MNFPVLANRIAECLARRRETIRSLEKPGGARVIATGPRRNALVKRRARLPPLIRRQARRTLGVDGLRGRPRNENHGQGDRPGTTMRARLHVGTCFGN